MISVDKNQDAFAIIEREEEIACAITDKITRINQEECRINQRLCCFVINDLTSFFVFFILKKNI